MLLECVLKGCFSSDLGPGSLRHDVLSSLEVLNISSAESWEGPEMELIERVWDCGCAFVDALPPIDHCLFVLLV